MADEEEEVSTGLELDTGEILMLVGVVLAAAVFLALYLDRSAVAGIGVGVVSSFASPVTAFFNGIAQAISGFFNWVSHALSNLEILGLGRLKVISSAKHLFQSVWLSVKNNISALKT